MKMLGLVILGNEQVFVLLGPGVEMGHKVRFQKHTVMI